MEQNEKLFNRNFITLAMASLLMYCAFYLLMPIIAMYVVDEFGASSSMAGIVVSSYIITALLARPFSGYLVDRFDRKRFYMISFLLFATFFIGYIIANSIGALIITRVFLGASFSLITTASSTLTIDVIPSKRRAEGIGYYGAIVVLAMAIGPMMGLYLKDLFSYHTLFIIATMCCFVGFGVGSFVKTKHRPEVEHQKLSLDRFFLIEGLPIATIVALLYFLSGSLMAYVSLYARESGLDVYPANFFLYYSGGIIASRLISGKYLRNNQFYLLLNWGIPLIIAAGIMLTLFINNTTFVVASLFMGLGFGVIAPSMQSMVVELAPASRRGTANSTYFIALDCGAGLGMLFGGFIAQASSYKTLYMVGVALTIIALILYLRYAARHPRNENTDAE